jgi:serine/threonine protein kinase
MASLRHANLCELHAAFVSRGELWLVTQLHEAGSCADILRLKAPTGLEEIAAAAVLREVCQALSYLHSIGIIHRQLKAAAVLVDARARVRLSDLSLAGALLEFGERRRARQTFVGYVQSTVPAILTTCSAALHCCPASSTPVLPHFSSLKTRPLPRVWRATACAPDFCTVRANHPFGLPLYPTTCSCCPAFPTTASPHLPASRHPRRSIPRVWGAKARKADVCRVRADHLFELPLYLTT